MFEAGKKYQVEILEAYSSLSKAKGTPGLTVGFRADNGDTISHTFYLTPATTDRFLETMKDCFGLEAGVFRSEDFWDDPLSMLAGQRCEIITKNEPWQGKDRIVVNYVNPVASKRVASSSIFVALFGGPEEQQNLPGTTPFD